MRLPSGTLKKLSKKSALPHTKISDYACARTRPGRKRAIYLEQTIGVKAAIWMFGSADEIKQAILDHGNLEKMHDV